MRHCKNWDRLIEHLLSSDTVTAAAARAGISRQHTYRLMRDADFQARLRGARNEAHSHALSRLCRLAGKAVTTLEDCLDGKDIPKARLWAARCVLVIATAAVTADIEGRIEEVEGILAKLERNVT